MKGAGIPRGAVLVGFMGAGKSSVGKELARRLDAEFVDVDDRIEAASGMRIRDIFSAEGEQGFRDRERKAIRESVSVPGRVIATGGGAFLDGENRRLLKEYAPVIYLEVSPASVIERLGGDRSRPLLAGEEREKTVGELMKRRRPAYREADFRVSTENLSAEQVAERVHVLLAGKGKAGGTGRKPAGKERRKG